MTKYNQIRKQSLWRILWNKFSWKLGTILTKACKGIQYLGKPYTAITKPLPLKLIPLQVLLTKTSAATILVHINIYWKSSTRIDREKFQKTLKTLLNGCFSNQHSKELLCSFLLKSKSQKIVCLWWRIVASCISHTSGKVLPINFL